MRRNNILLITGLLIILVGSMINSMIRANEEPIRYIPRLEEPKDSIRLDTFSEANLNIVMSNLEIQHPDIVMAQTKLETGNFKSYLFRVSNNLFGFRNYNGYKKYKTWQASVEDYSKWQSKHYKKGDYYKYLKQINYAEDSLYIYKLKQFK